MWSERCLEFLWNFALEHGSGSNCLQSLLLFTILVRSPGKNYEVTVNRKCRAYFTPAWLLFLIFDRLMYTIWLIHWWGLPESYCPQHAIFWISTCKVKLLNNFWIFRINCGQDTVQFLGRYVNLWSSLLYEFQLILWNGSWDVSTGHLQL